MTTLANRPNTALLVIDVQNGVVEGAHERDAVVSNIGDLVEKARREQVPVVWVQHNDEQLERGTDNWRIVPELKPDDSEPLIEKNYGDAFEDTNLEKVLSGLGVGRLVVTGAQTDACVRSTLHGAFTRGYDATLVSDAHTTEDLTAWGRRRQTRSSRTRTCTGKSRPRQGERPGRSRPKTSTSAVPPKTGYRSSEFDRSTSRSSGAGPKSRDSRSISSSRACWSTRISRRFWYARCAIS